MNVTPPYSLRQMVRHVNPLQIITFALPNVAGSARSARKRSSRYSVIRKN